MSNTLGNSIKKCTKINLSFFVHAVTMVSLQVKMDRSSGKSRGFGFIRFKTIESAQKAMNDSHEMDGRKLVVRLSQREVGCTAIERQIFSWVFL